ncbi:MAG: ADP-ribosylation factor-like protein [Candidatus Hodarchaeota archaeon]
MTESNTQNKILFIGLDNSGKTSIVQCLQGIKNLPSFFNIKPTEGLDIKNINALDSEFAIWDLGGQETFRNEYLRDFNKYVIGCNKLIYVFDIQDIKRYDLALEYFGKIIDILKENSEAEKIEISIFLHKFDPDLNVTRPDITKEIFNDFKEKIKKRIEKTDFFYQIFKTTVYALFEKIILD